MQNYARMATNNVVVEIIALPTGVKPEEAFHAAVASTLLACGPAVERGWLRNGSGFAAPPVVAVTADDLKNAAADHRRALIDTGCIVGSGAAAIPTWADSESQGALTALVVAAQLNPNITAGWKGRDGTFYPLDAARIMSLALGVMAFVQACFGKEQTALAGIAAGTITTSAAVDAVFE